MTATRRLTAILAADVAGYSRLMEADEEGTHERLRAHLRELIEPKIAEHRGRIVKNTGDGFLAEFASVVDAVRCAMEVQRGMAERNAAIPPEKRIEFRIGINLGDVIAEGEDIFGDGVNVAARLEGLAEPGGLLVSNTCTTTPATGYPSPLRISASTRSRTLLGRCGFTGFATPPPRGHRHRLRLRFWWPTSRRLRFLPFANMSGDPEQEYFADGMVEEIITTLSRIRWLFVIARNSSFTYKGQAVDVKQVGRELGVRYVLEGSVRKAAGRVRITAQLIEAATGTHLWADRFDGSLEDVFEVQDKVASSVAGVIEPALRAAETVRSAGRPTANLTAYDLYLRAYAMVWSSARQSPEALLLMEQAIERDPHYGPALAWAAYCCYRLLVDDRSEYRGADALKGADFARRALQVAGNDPGVLANAYFGEDIGAMIALVDRALALNPHFARGWLVSGTLRLWGGPARHRDRACRSRTTPQSSRPHRHVFACDRRRTFRQPALR